MTDGASRGGIRISAVQPCGREACERYGYASPAFELMRNSCVTGQSSRLDGAIRMAPRWGADR